MIALLACGEDGALNVAQPHLRVEASELDFGPVPEGERSTKEVEVANVGAAPLEVEARLETGSSSDFFIVTRSASIEPSFVVALEVRFEPTDPGTDEGVLVLASNDSLLPEVRVELIGGPIQPALFVSARQLDFGPAGDATEVSRTLRAENRGSARLTLTHVGLDPSGSPEFELVSPAPGSLEVAAGIELTLRHRRSGRAEAGRLTIASNDPSSPEVSVSLFPDPFSACANGSDDDGDLVVDFPDDPGCESREDDDETDPPDCSNGETVPCGNPRPPCQQGSRTCVDGAFGPCEGAFDGSSEVCNGIDDDCDGRLDEAIVESCDLHGCAGARTCVEGSTVAGGRFGPCESALATAESCDGTDEDCDGEIDEDLIVSCSIHGCAGESVCLPGGTGQLLACVPLSSEDEVCNGVDDDCDGVEDDGIPDQRCGVGACLRVVPGCLNGTVPACVPGTGTSEACNGDDDDCNGAIDDGISAQTCGLGECRRTVSGCSGGAVPACVPGAAGVEVCGNGVDEDCDGADAVCSSCGLMSTAPDPQEPNNSQATPRPVVAFPGWGFNRFDYQLTFPQGDTSDWIEIRFPAPNPSGGFAELQAAIGCASWAAGGCGAPATVALEVWYFDDCFPQLDDSSDGRAGLAFVSSSGLVSSTGICGQQRFRVRAYPSVAVCSGEAVQAELSISVNFTQ